MDKTKKLIAYALIELLDMYTYEEINITMISQEAEISRRTFYRHFDEKDDVIKHMYHLLFDKKATQIIEERVVFEDLLIPLFDLFYQNRAIFKKLFKNHRHELIRKEMNQLFIDYNTVNKPRLMNESPIFIQYYTNYHTSAMLSILSAWVMNDCHETTEEVVQIYQRILKSETFHDA